MLFHSLEDSDFCCEPRLTYIMMTNGLMTSLKSAHVHAGLVRTAVSLIIDHAPEVEIRQFRSEGLVCGKIHSGLRLSPKSFSRSEV